MTDYGSDFLVDWGPRDTFLDPIFAQLLRNTMRTSVLATVRAFSSQRRRAAGRRAGCRAGIPRARAHPTEIAARIQPDLRIQIVHALSQLDSCTRGWMGGRACDGMESTARTGRAAQYV